MQPHALLVWRAGGWGCFWRSGASPIATLSLHHAPPAAAYLPATQYHLVSNEDGSYSTFTDLPADAAFPGSLEQPDASGLAFYKDTLGVAIEWDFVVDAVGGPLSELPQGLELRGVRAGAHIAQIKAGRQLRAGAGRAGS